MENTSRGYSSAQFNKSDEIRSSVRTHRIARALRAGGVKRGDGVVCVAANPPEVQLIGLAAHILGIRYTPLSLGPATENLEHILADAVPDAVVFDPARAAAYDHEVPE